MTSKRSFNQREDEPWLRYPDSHNRDFSRSSSTPHHDPLDQTIVPSASTSSSSLTTTPVTNHKRSISKLSAPSSSSTIPSNHSSNIYHRGGGGGHDSFLHRSSFSSSSYSSRNRAPPPRTLSEELSMALQNPENSYPSPVNTPSVLLSSPADLSSSTRQSPASSISPKSVTSTFSTTHFPLFKPSIPTSQQSNDINNNNSGGQKLRPSPLSLYTSGSPSHGSISVRSHLHGNLASPSSPFRSGSPTSAITRDSTTATYMTGSPRGASQAVAATLGVVSPLSPRSQGFQSNYRVTASMFSGTEASSSSLDIGDSPMSLHPTSCSPLCHSGAFGQQQQHHSSCVHNRHATHQDRNPMDFSQQSVAHHGPKPGRATKGIHRFGFPQFRPEMDDTHPGSDDGSQASTSTAMTAATTRSASTSTGYGMPRGRRHEDDLDMDDEDDLGGLGRTYASEPPKKRMRSTASMLLDAAVETVIFTGAVALSAYQLLTGKGKLGLSNNANNSNPTSGSNSVNHSKQASSASSQDMEDRSRDDASKALDEDPMEEKLALVSDVKHMLLYDMLLGRSG
jgi:hypothetical protein